MNKGKIYFKNKLSAKIEKKSDGTFELDYEPGSTTLSWTLPNSLKKYQSEELFPFFDGLIPEGWLLNLAEKNWKIPKNDRMTLLLTTCQDCIGAVHIHDANQNGDHLKNKNQNNKNQSASSKKNQNSQLAKLDFSNQCLICMNELRTDEQMYHKNCARELFGFNQAPLIDIALEDLEKLALLQINQRLTLTGVQQKLSLTPVLEDKNYRLTVVGVEGRFILKPSTDNFPEMAENEHLCMKLAELIGIPVANCGLVYMMSGERAYLTKRFDRIASKNNLDEKIQIEDFCQLSEKMTSQKYSGSSESLGKIIDKYSHQPLDDKLTLFQIILFSFWIGNSDMHLKNFSLWSDPKSGLVRMSPGYDFLSTRLLIPASQDKEELALPVNGRKNKIKWSDFLAFGENLKLPRKTLENVRNKMLDLFFECDALIEQSFLSPGKKEELRDLMIERSGRLMAD